MAPAAESRIVVIGDLNGADDVLIDILRGTGLVNRRLRWIGGRSELVQMGDLFNRGGGALRAFRLLLDLGRQARRAGGKVTVLLGNHEAMMALRHEGYCTEDEYLAFASEPERKAWPLRVQRAHRRLAREHRPQAAILPIGPRLEAWKIANVPGRAMLRRALGPRGTIGRALRRLPTAYAAEGALFVHAGLLPEWAKLGIQGINEKVWVEWQKAPRFIWSLPKSSVFRSAEGPLWDRSLVRNGPKEQAKLRRSLELLGMRRMVVGHTQTASTSLGREGEILALARGRLILVDVGLRSGANTPRTALILEGSRGLQWTPSGTRMLWNDGARSRRSRRAKSS